MSEQQVQVRTEDGKTCEVYVSPQESTVEDLMVLIEVELSIPLDRQFLFFKGNRLAPFTALLRTFGLFDGNSGSEGGKPCIFLRQRPADPAPGNAARANNSAVGVPQQQQQPPLVPSIQQQQEQSAPAPVPNADPNQRILDLFQRGTPSTNAPPMNPNELVMRLFEQGERRRQQPQQVLDPMDPDVQRRLYEQIQQQNLRENLEQAIEYTPEAFARVVMLYVPAIVNKQPITAFVDSGAQTTIMNERTAERCGLMRLLDRRMQGFAKGVGMSRILGRVHMALVGLGGIVVPMSITVLESQDMDFLIGLDQLRRHQMCINLKENALVVQDISIPFLAEHELPEEYRNQGEEPQKKEGPQEGGSAAASGGGQRAQAASRTPTPPPSSRLDPEKEVKISNLMALTSKSRQEIIAVLEASEWNEDTAALLLLQ